MAMKLGKIFNVNPYHPIIVQLCNVKITNASKFKW